MLFVLSLASFIWLARSTGNSTIMIRVNDGDTVNLTCKLPKPSTVGSQAIFLWLKSSANRVPEVVAGTYSDCSPRKPNNPRFKAECDKSGSFLLHLERAQLRDTGSYYCVRVDYLTMDYINGTFLAVKGPEGGIDTVLSSDRSGLSVELQCSVFSDADNTGCSGEIKGYWFTSRHGQSLPNIFYTPDDCAQNLIKGQQKCVYNLSGEVAPSDRETHYCAVVSCGHILLGNGSKPDTKGSQCDKNVLLVLGGALTVTLGITAVLIFIVCRQKRELEAAGSFQTTATGDQRRQGNDGHLVYAMPTFSKAKAASRQASPNVENVIYSDAKVEKHRNRVRL